MIKLILLPIIFTLLTILFLITIFGLYSLSRDIGLISDRLHNTIESYVKEMINKFQKRIDSLIFGKKGAGEQ